MKIALIGYGAMGRELDALAESEQCIVTNRYDEQHPLTPSAEYDWDVAIDFSRADAVVQNVAAVVQAGKSIVIGTTGWYANQAQVQQMVQSSSVGCIVGTNFSVGVQMFFRLARAAGMLVNTNTEYDVAVHEWHHTKKADSPSGTALTLAEILVQEVERKTGIETETAHHYHNPSMLHLTSTRVGMVTGKHLVTIDGPDDRIELVHDARNRSGFARGALRAARWIHTKQGYYDFTDVFMQVIA